MRALALRLAAWILAGLVVFPAVAGAREIWRSGDAFVEFAGTLRQIVRTSEQTDEDDFRDALRSGDPNCIPPGLAQPPLLPAGNFEDCVAFGEVGEERAVQSLSRLRLEIDVGVTSWLTGHVVADNELFAGDLDTLEATLGDDLSSDSFFGAEDNVTQNDHAAWRTLLYRGYLRAELGPTEWIVGRQRIAWGVGRLWNPIDRFNPIPPLAIEGDQSEGIDAVLARWNFDGFNAVEAIYAPGSSQDDARYALRVLGVTLDTDWSVMAGVFERAPTVGFDLARNLGDAAIRFEVVYADPTQNYTPLGAGSSQEQGDFWQVVGSIDYTLDLGSGLYLLLEHLYNGNALGFGRGRAGARRARLRSPRPR